LRALGGEQATQKGHDDQREQGGTDSHRIEFYQSLNISRLANFRNFYTELNGVHRV
jgi:hypothetical protein